MTESIGGRLQQARRSKEITLHEVSKETKIGEEYLEALEKEEYDLFPAKIYVVSFLRSYARYLGLDAESLVQIYQREHTAHSDKMDLNPEFPIMVTHTGGEESAPEKGFRSLRLTKKGLIPFILAIGVVVSVGFLAILSLRSALREFSQKVMVNRNPSINFARDISMAAETIDKTWLRIIGDGEVFFEGILFPGEKGKWVAKDEMSVRIGNVNGIKLYLNREEVDIVSGNLGQVNELIFTRLKERRVIKIERKQPLTVRKIEPLQEQKLQEEENK